MSYYKNKASVAKNCSETSMKVKSFVNPNCKTTHFIPAFMRVKDFQYAMDYIFEVRGGLPMKDYYGIYRGKHAARRVALLRLKDQGVLIEVDGQFFPSEQYLSLFVSAKKRGFYYWAGHETSVVAHRASAAWAKQKFAADSAE